MVQLVVLDLDETLIHSVLKTNIRSLPVNANRLHVHEFAGFLIYERPYLRSFIKRMSKKYQLAIWTAATSPYAHFIVHHILTPHLTKGTSFLFMWHSDHCSKSSNLYQLPKMLRMVHEKYPQYPLHQIVLLDDRKDYRNQSGNVLTAPEFLCDADDHYLRDVDI